MENNHFIIDISSPQKNYSLIVESKENPIVNISFQSVREKKIKDLNTNDIFSKKWVLNKLIEMECERIDEIKNSLSGFQKPQQSKEDLLNVALDAITNQSINNKEKSILDYLYEESKEMLKESFENLYKNYKITTKKEYNNELLSQSLPLNQDNHSGNAEFVNSKNKSLIIEKNKEIEVKNDCNLIHFSVENSVNENTKKEIKQEEKSPFLFTFRNSDLTLFPFNNKNLDNSTSKSKIIINPSTFMDSPTLLAKMSPTPKIPIETKLIHLKKLFTNWGVGNLKELDNNNGYIDNQGCTYTCDICYEMLKQEKKLKAGKCEHLFCKSCLKAYLTEMIKSGKVLKIACPKEGCNHKYTEEEIKNVLKNHPETIKKYERFKLQISLSKDPNIRWCIRPDCDNFIKGSPDKPKLTCSCGEIICFNCSRKWHEGKTCEELMDLEYESYRLKNNVIKCPKCQSRIEKISGCNHITCTRCRYEFCWICSRKYSKRHYKPYNIFGCPGMMYRTFQRDKNFKKKLLQIRIFNFLKALAYFILILFLPIIAVFMLVGIPNIIYHHDRRAKCNCKGFWIFFLLTVIGIIMFPIFLILAIVPGSCIFLYQLKKEF